MKTFIIGDRVRFSKDDQAGTIVRAFFGGQHGKGTYLVRLDKPDEDGRLRAAGSSEIEPENAEYRTYLAGRTDPRD